MREKKQQTFNLLFEKKPKRYGGPGANTIAAIT